ncbi:SDR family oxidoreductase [Stieleria sp. TO1_6]|uniref:SDR family oxidoreductase n=1 Tax=Stieleria tagensis TaxID=2956795 RepID=UPI00209BA2D1|nr:SDR family oxidoreductase [Stieleria tagensis]MCO8122007.1 SDR family oxidoreductase [Stieleria tagensis]
MAFDVKGKTVLVTGANRGIGLAIVQEAIDRGAAKVYAAVRKLDSAAPLVVQYGDKLIPVHLDLEDPATIQSAAGQASDVDVVVNNAGVLKTASALSDDAIESLQYEIDINVFGLMRMAQAFAPVLKKNGGGALVQLNSVVSVKTFADIATYSASKAASYSITQGLRESLADQSTQVVSVHPGPIQTDMAHNAGLDDVAESPSLVASAIFDAIADGRFHVWPDSMAKQIGGQYQSFAENVVEAEMQENPA